MKVKISKVKTHKKRGLDSLDIITSEASIKKLIYFDALLTTCNLPQREYKEIYNKGKLELSEGQIDELIEYLEQNQRNSVLGGFNYQMKDIKKQLSKLR